MASHTWFIQQLESTRLMFNDDTYILSQKENNSFQACYELLKEDAISLAKRSRARRSVRSRARNLLVDVFKGTGRDTFLLCILAACISTLATVEIKGLVPALRQWWTTVRHPKGLTVTANQVCEANLIDSLIVPTGKRNLSKTASTRGLHDFSSLKD
jgi:hypothetical protein